ncbi:alpha/beta hydrolase [Agromyces atrinae]|uniref:alpha/beta fold hydrolase n=1 Tax=Agromyces atrinae TaxID=592376 RepID=UPI001F571463|nr:alpha/beta hydrolase [Agromyces atrinae]MCI2956756.1 alpha/beta hydrolase [Agromyces atrinae]
MAESSYMPFPVSTDAADFGLATHAVPTSLGRVSVHYRRERLARDRGTAVILLHGAAGSWTTWTPLLAADRERRAGGMTTLLGDVVIPDLPGWGATPRPVGREFTVDALVRVVAEIARALGYERWIVVGHSSGGFIGLQLAARETSATRGVVAVSPTTHAVIEAVRRPLRGLRLVPAFTGLLAVMRVLARNERGGRRFVKVLDRLGLLRLAVSPLFRHPLRVDASAVRAIATDVRPTSFVLGAADAAHASGDYWRSITCAVETLHGRRDVFLHANDDVRLAAEIPRFHSTVLDEAGHFAPLEQPRAVLDVLARVAAPGNRQRMPRASESHAASVRSGVSLTR